MPFKPVHFLLTDTLRGLGLVLCMLLAISLAPAAHAIPLLPDSGDETGIVAPTDTTTQTTGTATGTTDITNSDASKTDTNSAAALATPAPANTVISATNPLCNPKIALAYDKAREKALTVQLSRDNEFFKYQISAAFAANCVGKMIDYAQKLGDAVASVQTAAGAGNPIQAAVTLIAHQILNAVFRQIVNNLMNQICSVTNQITQAMDSYLNNAICIPTANLGLNGLFNFNINLNLPNLQCDGIAINPLALTEIDPATGQPYAQAESNYTRGAISTYGTGDNSTSSRNELPAMRDNRLSGTSADIYGEPDPIDDPDYEPGVAYAGPVNGNACIDIAKATAALMNNVNYTKTGAAKSPYLSLHACANYVRRALEAGGMSTVGRPVYAKNYGPFLEANGYEPVSSSSSPGGYVPQAGDIIVEQPYPGGNIAGHIQMYSGSAWASDYIARGSGMYGGSGYAAHPNYIIYRPKTKTANSSSCK